jgi:hypothetical protein
MQMIWLYLQNKLFVCKTLQETQSNEGFDRLQQFWWQCIKTEKDDNSEKVHTESLIHMSYYGQEETQIF